MAFRRWGALLGAVLLVSASCVGSGHYVSIRGNTADFYLDLPEAGEVQLAVGADGFKLHPAARMRNGTWKVTVPVHDNTPYFYVVDGRPFTPDCLYKQQDDFGSENCIFLMDR